ncbi:MAG: ImmA/IrrE family metallo-endopeptidase [Deltaproteobacteria bacterium]|nr:ImmA/IrrE family metallo-endopeptidase [Deltaproteobacteria bacterium]
MIPELKVPYLKESDIEHAAMELLRRYSTWKGAAARPPIDVDNIVEGYFGLDLAFIDLTELLGMPDVLGATFLKEKRVFIEQSLDLEGKEGRLAFTLAHESGHWYMHRPLIEAERVVAPLFSTSEIPEQPAIVCRSSQKKARAEWQADLFAACLLMPSADVRATMKALCGDKAPTWERVEERRKKRELDERLRDLAAEVIERGRFTNVSNEAMRYRLLDLNLVIDASNPQRSLL